MPPMHRKKLPGSLWVNKGRWNWRVTPPGDVKRRNFPLKAPGAQSALPSSAPRRTAEEAAWLMVAAWNVEPQDFRGHSAGDIPLSALLALYADHCKTYYRRKDGSRTDTAKTEAWKARSVVQRLGPVRVADLRHADLLPVRDAMIADGFSRRVLNDCFNSWGRMLRWALDEALVRPADVAELSQMRALKPYRSAAREPEPVREPDRRAVKAVLALLPRNAADAVRLMERTGMRPSEALSIRFSRIERRRDGLWIYRPATYKTEWVGKPRAVVLGPAAQRILARYAGMDPAAPVFSPDAAVEDAAEGLVAPLQASGAAWPEKQFAQYIRRVLAEARKRGRLTEDVRGFSIAHLRHGTANRVRRWFGLTACKAVLGHSMRGGVTDVYTRESIEDEIIRLAAPAMRRLG